MAFGRTSALATVCHLSLSSVSLDQCLFHRWDVSPTRQMSLETSNHGVKRSGRHEAKAGLLKCLFSACGLPRCLHALEWGKKRRKNCGLAYHDIDSDIAGTRPGWTALTFIGVKQTENKIKIKNKPQRKSLMMLGKKSETEIVFWSLDSRSVGFGLFVGGLELQAMEAHPIGEGCRRGGTELTQRCLNDAIFFLLG